MNALQSWWVSFADGPELLFSLRVVSCVLACLSAILWWRLARTPILESTWRERDHRAFRTIVTLVALGVTMYAIYFALAGTLEFQRTSSPHRLIVGNTAAILTFAPLGALALFLRFVFTRKAAIRERDARVEAAGATP